MGRQGLRGVPPRERPDEAPEWWVRFLADCRAYLCVWTDPVTEDKKVIIRRRDAARSGGGKHLFGKHTRDAVVSALVRVYGSVGSVNAEIEKYMHS